MYGQDEHKQLITKRVFSGYAAFGGSHITETNILYTYRRFFLPQHHQHGSPGMLGDKEVGQIANILIARASDHT
jgi:hypothetical protein